jgi:DNA sulfur modification protein DndB
MVGRSVLVIEGVRRNEISDGESSLIYYSGRFDSSVAKAITFVPVARGLLDSKLPLKQVGNGYQRSGKLARMKKFASYLETNPLPILPPVLLSTRNKWRFTPRENKNFGDLHIDTPAAIIDGQHRIGGFIILHESEGVARSIDFLAYDGLDKVEEASVFLTINGNAKGVPKGIIRIIEGNWTTSVAEKLSIESDSPFYQKIFISAASEIDGSLLSLDAIATAVKTSFSHGSFTQIVENEDTETMYSILVKYWNLISENFPEEWEDINEDKNNQTYKLLEWTGVFAWSLTATDILGPNFDPNTTQIDWGAVQELIEGIANSGDLDLRKRGDRGARADFEGMTGKSHGPTIHRKIQQIMAQL